MEGLEALERLEGSVEVFVEGSAVVFWAVLDPVWVEGSPAGFWVEYSPPGSEAAGVCLQVNADDYLVWV